MKHLLLKNIRLQGINKGCFPCFQVGGAPCCGEDLAARMEVVLDAGRLFLEVPRDRRVIYTRAGSSSRNVLNALNGAGQLIQ